MINLKYQYILITILCLLPALCFAQQVYEGQVINKTTELAIPGVTIKLLQENIGTQTNQQGYFNIESEKPIANDTLQFSSVGYNTFKLPVSAYEPQMFITLEPSTTQLDEVRITNSKIKTITLGKFSHYDLKNISGAGYIHLTKVVTSRTPLAKLFTAPQANGRLTGIALGRQDFPTSPTFSTTNKFTTFLIHVIAQDTATGTPGKVLFTKTISLSDKSKWIDIDVTNDIIVIPGSNFFIAVEWMNIPYNEIIGINRTSKVDRLTKRGAQVLEDASEYRVYYQPFLIGYENEKTLKPAVLYTKIDNKWQITRQAASDVALSASVRY
jgi:hypothetical protein